MFKSSLNSAPTEYSVNKQCLIDVYSIVDTNFTETLFVEDAPVWLERGFIALTDAIINLYSRRNHNIAQNLALFFLWIEKCWYIDIATALSLCQRNVPEFPKYDKDVQKYLLLM